MPAWLLKIWLRNATMQQKIFTQKIYSPQAFGWADHKIKNLDVVPEGEGEVCDIGITLSDQEGAISPPDLCAVIVDQTLAHQPALLHAAMKPGLCIVVLKKMSSFFSYLHMIQYLFNIYIYYIICIYHTVHHYQNCFSHVAFVSALGLKSTISL